MCGRIGSLSVGVKVLKLVEWLLLGFIESRKMRKVQVLFEIISPETCESQGYVLSPVVMVACGALRALRVASARYRLDFDPRLKEAPEWTIRFAAEKAGLEGKHVHDRRLLLQCVALGLTQCGQISSHESVLCCVCMALLEELLPLPDLLKMSVQSPDGNSAAVVKNRVKQHLDSILFKEAGPVTGILCNQYSFASDKAKTSVEICIWEYAQVQDKSLWRSWEGSTEPCKKILDLLLRLIFLVDIQSFPYLLKELAEFVTLLPKEGQDVLLDDMHAHVAESDDVTRKPVLVSWLQSLSYISSQATHCESVDKDANACSMGSDELSLNRTMARL
ncbi:hypothetical protein E2562_029552 [Oryza meyeriana var. granulata]|uniref:Uncharacterized protein n=1 Tax=Oryza meyeriana var. granulata TaxID=110450 RepID=A0A6G1FDV7_9ORYZ|nr:hypothetical protein E2562_029552 [Oryza meyeriana var. granulata]